MVVTSEKFKAIAKQTNSPEPQVLAVSHSGISISDRWKELMIQRRTTQKDLHNPIQMFNFYTSLTKIHSLIDFRAQ